MAVLNWIIGSSRPIVSGTADGITESFAGFTATGRLKNLEAETEIDITARCSITDPATRAYAVTFEPGDITVESRYKIFLHC